MPSMFCSFHYQTEDEARLSLFILFSSIMYYLLCRLLAPVIALLFASDPSDGSGTQELHISGLTEPITFTIPVDLETVQNLSPNSTLSLSLPLSSLHAHTSVHTLQRRLVFTGMKQTTNGVMKDVQLSLLCN